jgi:folate-dependent phosphoribosylglycinamide formyltransferase PurN
LNNDNQKAVINLVILLSDNGSNIKSQLEAFKNQIYFKAPGVIL